MHDDDPNCTTLTLPPAVPSAPAMTDEGCRLAGDDRDREEMRIVREQLADLAPPLLD
jgi:hypothetical protein